MSFRDKVRDAIRRLDGGEFEARDLLGLMPFGTRLYHVQHALGCMAREGQVRVVERGRSEKGRPGRSSGVYQAAEFPVSNSLLERAGEAADRLQRVVNAWPR